MQTQIVQNNWLTILLAPMQEANSTTVQILAHAWSIYETRQTNWISHFLEHMFFKWGIKYKTPKEVAATIDAIWGNFNAFTWDYIAWYYVKSAPDYTNIALDVLSDMLVNAQFPQAEMEREKWVVIQEIMMYNDLPQKLVLDKFQRFYYGNNPYGWPTLGSVENIKSFSREHLFAHKQWLYTKDNLIIIVAWKIQDQDKIVELIGKLFKDLPNKKTINKPPFPTQRPSKHEEFFEKWTEQVHLVIWGPGFKIDQEQKYAAGLLNVILGGNMSSRLFQQIREKRWLCYYIGSSHYASVDDGLLLIRAGLEKQRFEYGKQAIFEELEKIKKWDVTEEEFQKAQGYIQWKTKMGIETSDQLADFVWEQYLLQDKIQSLEDILNHYKKVSLEDIKNIAKQLLQKSNLYSYWIQ